MREFKRRAWVHSPDSPRGFFLYQANPFSLYSVKKNDTSGQYAGYGYDISDWENWDEAPQPIFEDYIDLKNKDGVEIYEGDIYYLAGHGNCVAEFPFIDFYEAALENDIGDHLGNIHENPELL